MDSSKMTTEMEALKSRLRATWIAGNFGEIAVTYSQGANDFVNSLNIAKGGKVLDVACGTGNQSLPAARLGADVTGIDLAPNLIDQAKAGKCEIQLGKAVRAIADSGEVTFEDASRISAGTVVNAAGPWSPTLSPGLPVKKRKGHLIITERYPGYVRHQIIELGYLKSAHSSGTESVAFNIQPRKTGQMLIGSSRQFEVEGTEINAHILDRMVKRASEYLPNLGDLVATRSWAGHRAATPDKLPLIGPLRDNSRIWLATGHEGLGITTALGTAHLLGNALLGRATAIPATPYLPARLLLGPGKEPCAKL